MSLEREPVSRENLGVLGGCLVEGDPEQRRGERRVRRRALVISVGVQATIVAALILIPLFGKPERIVLAYVPMPVYSHAAPKATRVEAARTQERPQTVCRFCPPRAVPTTIVTHDPEPPDEQVGTVPIPGNGPIIPGGIPLGGSSAAPPRVEEQVQVPRVVHVTHIDPALLIRRVEPVYPTLMRQIGRSGRVELRAVIATDGSIQSLQVVSGDPGFYQSAMEAVRQWRYRPTVLNGQQVQIDTFITVIYNMQR